MSAAILFPAYRPSEVLVELVGKVAERCALPIVVIDDGSGPSYQDIFRQCEQFPRVRVIRHAVNLGKGAALKTGINFALCACPALEGIVTADADGQHDTDDIAAISAKLLELGDCLVLGVREFGNRVPFRSRFGNILTRWVVRLLVGRNVSDTQTGLRGIPAILLPHLLKIPSNGYEFELDMLIACKHHNCRIVEERIETIYLEGNRSSHFNPVRDSMKIYFVLLRFGLLSLLTAALDNLVFIGAYLWTESILRSQIVGRFAAVAFNYGAARRAVFLSGERHQVLLPKYLLLVVCSGAVSYLLIRAVTLALPVEVIWAKISAEAVLFALNFIVQRDFVFMKERPANAATDWNDYYLSVPVTAKLTRKYTSRVLLKAVGRTSSACPAIVEIGGANSCFLDRILREVKPRIYHVVDNNEYGLELLRRRMGSRQSVVLHRQDVLDLSLNLQADVVFSVGLIEHFDSEGTRKAISKHFDLLRPGGHAIISFPTPTLLYRAARGVAESFGLWKFPDERPLTRREVLDCVAGSGEPVFQKTLWPLVFTQHLIVVRKRGSWPAA